VQDYLAGAPTLAPFFTGSPWDPDAYRRKAEEVDRRFGPSRRMSMAEAIRPTSAAAAAKLDRITSGDGFFVTTGQQAGLFTGPLFTIYKALTAVRLAAALEELLGCPVAPLFWVASDDHDWEEVNHVHVIDSANRLARIEVQDDADTPLSSMARRRWGPGLEAALEQLTASVPPTEFAGPLFEELRAAYQVGSTVAESFGDAVASLLSRFDLLIVDASHPALKMLALDVLVPELDHWAKHVELLAAQTARLEAAGYHAQVPVLPDAANLFVEDETGRDRLAREGSHWVLRRSGRRIGDADLRALLQLDPSRFSPNVVLRPVVESASFPTLAYVAGPGELSYYAQIGCLFRAHGIEMPLVYPRASITLVEPKVRKVMSKFGLAIEDLRRPAHEVAARVFRDELPEGIQSALRELRRSLNEGYERLAAAVPEVDPTLKGPALGARNAAMVGLEELEKKIVQHLKRRNAIGLEQLEKAVVNIGPLGQPQERVVNVYPYLARYGPDLLGAIADAIPVRLGAPAPAWEGVKCS